MRTLHATGTDPLAVTAPDTPGTGRRLAVGAAGALALVLPTIFTVNITRMLLTGAESEHRFHQATGQGLILFAIWLGALVPLVVAGWRGRRPSSLAGIRHVALVGVGTACAVAAPGGGAPFLVAVVAVTGALLWAVLPRRPRLRVAVLVDPLLAPVAMLVAAFLTPYAVAQVGLQNAAVVGDHAANPHYFDMAWVALTLVVLAVAAATLRGARPLMSWVAGACLVLGAAGVAFGEGTAWSLTALGLGGLAGAVTVVRGRLEGPR